MTLRSRLRIRPGSSPSAVIRPFHGAGQHAHTVLQQRAVGRRVHVGFYDRRIDAKAAAARHPRPLRDLDHLPMQMSDDVRPQRAGNLQNRLGVRHLARIDARKRAIHQVGADFLLQVVVAPVKQVLQDQHPDHDLRRRAWTSAATTVRPSCLECLGHDLNHGLVLEHRIDPPQPVGPQFVPIGQQHFEQTPLALSASDHAHSFEASLHINIGATIRAGK